MHVVGFFLRHDEPRLIGGQTLLQAFRKITHPLGFDKEEHASHIRSWPPSRTCGVTLLRLDTPNRQDSTQTSQWDGQNPSYGLVDKMDSWRIVTKTYCTFGQFGFLEIP